MFTRIALKNFKSFKEVEINLQEKKSTPKPLAIIYGINGSGKTTIAQAFVALERTLQTMQVKDMLNDLLTEESSVPEDFPFKSEVWIKVLKSRLAMNSINSLIEEYKMINSDGNMVLEYEFKIEDSCGVYYLEVDDVGIVKERLEYKINKRRGCYFNLEEGALHVNKNIFETQEFYDLVYEQVERYWGKHSLFSILYYEMSDKSEAYTGANISTNLMDVMQAFWNIDFKVPFVAGGEKLEIASDNKVMHYLTEGTIASKEKETLLRIETLLNQFFTALFGDIEQVYYKISDDHSKIQYNLYLKKKMGGYVYDIDFDMESRGTKEILELLPYLIAAVLGGCVIIDEYGVGIHDLLSAKLLEAITPQITGQLIITTYNTLLMDCASGHKNISSESLYYILDQKESGKAIRCVTEIEDRLHPNYNYQTRYFSNALYREYLPDVRNDINLEEWSELYKNKT